MASPNTSTIQPLLAITGSFDEFDYRNQGFIGLDVFSVIEARKSKGTFGRVKLAEKLKNAGNSERRPGSGYNRDRIIFEDEPYKTIEYGEEEVIDDNEEADFADYFDHQAMASDRARNKVLTATEKRIAAQVMDLTFYNDGANTADNTTEWSDLANADPANDVRIAREKVFGRTGIYPNAVCMNQSVFHALRACEKFKSLISSQGAGQEERASLISIRQVAEAFAVDYVYVAGGVHDTANPNAAAPSPAHIWGNYCSVFIHTMSRDIRTTCLGRSIHWGGDGSVPLGAMEQYREDSVRGDVVRCRHQMDNKRIYPEAGHLIRGTAGGELVVAP